MFKPLFLALSVVLLSATAHAGSYSCSRGSNTNVHYRADFYVETERGDPAPGTFVYGYARNVPYKISWDAKDFDRADGQGRASVQFNMCVPKGKKAPDAIPMTIVIKDAWKGSHYQTQQMNIRIRQGKGWNSDSYPVILIEK